MGFFTWTLANKQPALLKNGDYSAKCKLRYGKYGAVVCPDGTLVEESEYEGYGMFGGRDVYELVVDWNKERLAEIIRSSALETHAWNRGIMTAIADAYAAGDDGALHAAVEKAAEDAPYMRTGWKRSLGIYISCGQKNAALPYPIKIVDRPVKTPYERLRPSDTTQ